MTLKKNKLGVKNSLVNNINAKKKAGTSKSKEESTVSKKSYEKMQTNWGEKKKKPVKKSASTSSAAGKIPAKKAAKKATRKMSSKSSVIKKNSSE